MGIYALNSVEWVEVLWAVFKIRAVWININYRYVEDELAYLFDNADLKALVFERTYAPRVKGVLGTMPLLRHRIVIDDGSDADLEGLDAVPYEEAMASGSPRARLRPPVPPTTATSSTPVAPRACPRAWCGATRTSSSPSGAGSTRPRESA